MIEMQLRSSSVQIPETLVIIYLLSFPYLMQYLANIMLLSDMLESSVKPEYILHKLEEFDYIIGEWCQHKVNKHK